LQKDLKGLMSAKHIIVNLTAQNAHQVIDILTTSLSETNHVSPAFSKDVWIREQVFPTGLPTEPIPIAIPHADPDNVNESAVGIGILKSPVEFGQMGTDGSTKVNAYIIFLLAIKEREKQVIMIGQLIKLIQTGDLLEKLIEAQDASECLVMLNEALQETDR